MEFNRVLVVEDDQEMCELISDVLMGEGFSVTATGDSLEAAKLFKKEEVRCRHHRSEDERVKGPRSSRRSEESDAYDSCHHHHGLWNNRIGHQGDEDGGLRLHHKALSNG